MDQEKIVEELDLPISKMAATLHGSEIIKLAGEINEKIKQGNTLFNFTIGDFDPAIFPIPELLRDLIIQAYQENHTNYPAANGISSLRDSISAFIHLKQGLNYSPNEYLVASGARPLIYAAYQTIVDPGDKVVFPVPSWNNNHYSHLSGANAVMIQTRPENNFMPTAEELKDHLSDACLLALCSPLNPTGTTFTKEGLMDICKLVLEENQRRPVGSKPLYLIYDQIYWALTFGNTEHVDPISLLPELRPYTVFIDGISKSFAATGVRVGWAFGPSFIIDRMKSILGHIGAWAPKAEQVATAEYLKNSSKVDSYLIHLKERLYRRLLAFYDGFNALKREGFPVDAVAPQAAIYLTVLIYLSGKITPQGKRLESTADTTKYILDEAGVALVPFYAFGSPQNSPWYRLSVGTSSSEEIPEVIQALRASILKLKEI